MSNILLLFYFPSENRSIPCFYDQFAKAFEKKNHKVLLVNNFIPNQPREQINEYLIQKISDFNPDLIIAFNHIINQKIYEKTNCPVIAFEADTIEVFANSNLMEKYQDRLYLGILNKNRKTIVKEKLRWLKDDKILVIKSSTMLKPEKLNQDINISCIATLIGISNENIICKNLIKNINNKNYLDKFKLIHAKAIENWNDINDNDLKYLECTYEEFFHFMSFYSRLYILDNLASLGLHVYGKFVSLESIINLRDLFFSLKQDSILSISENQNLYNRSKLSVNVHFAHNIKKPEYSVYSWRVCDIMATASCLVSTECPALDQDFGKWIKIPQFSNRHEAYNLCKKLLMEENYRKDIVAGSQLAIKEGGFTFDNRVKEIEEFFNLKSDASKDDLRYEILNLKSDENKDDLRYEIFNLKSDENKHKLKHKIIRLIKNLLKILYKLNIERVAKLPKKIIKFLHKFF